METRKHLLGAEVSGVLDCHEIGRRQDLEKCVKDQTTEYVSQELHVMTHRNIPGLGVALESELQKVLGVPPESDLRGVRRAAMTQLRLRVRENARELVLEAALFDVLNHVGTVRKEVPMQEDGRPGMRVDVIVKLHNGQTLVIELKRSSHRVLVRRGAGPYRLSTSLHKPVNQVLGYGTRIRGSKQVRAKLKECLDGQRANRRQLRVVAGRYVSDMNGHILLDARATQSNVKIYSWDGLLTELEHILGL